MNVKVSIVASIVGAIMSSASFGTIANNKTINVVKTNSGIKNHVDATSSHTTFQWADKKIKKANLGPVAINEKISVASNDYLNQLTGRSSTKESTLNTVLAKTHNGKRGTKLTKYKQKYAGIEVFNREYNILMDKDFNLISSSGYLTNSTSAQLKNSLLKNADDIFSTPNNAILNAFSDAGGNSIPVSSSIKETKGDYNFLRVKVN